MVLSTSTPATTSTTSGCCPSTFRWVTRPFRRRLNSPRNCSSKRFRSQANLLTARMSVVTTSSVDSRVGLLPVEVQAHGVHAESLARGLRPIGKHVAKVRAALGTEYFSTNHSVAGIIDQLHVLAVYRLVKARPP